MRAEKIFAYVGREALITAGTLGSAQAFRATGYTAYAVVAVMGEGI